MKLAPEIPTIETLEATHPLSREAMQKVAETRIVTSEALRFGRSLLAIIGPCAMTDNLEEILEENKRITKFGEERNIVALHRVPPWKPRTNPEDWHGLETSDPETAHRIVTAVAEQNGNLAMEFGHTSHVRRYIAQTALGWRGSRNDSDEELAGAFASSDSSLPIGIKNGMDGHFENALEVANSLSNDRLAPATLLFRGGSDFPTKDEWVQQYKSILVATNGNLIVDAAHGGEQAHDPQHAFGKSALGQLVCMDSIISVAESTGRVPRGVMVEASDVNSPTDPVVRLDEAFEKIDRLAALHQQATLQEAAIAAD